MKLKPDDKVRIKTLDELLSSGWYYRDDGCLVHPRCVDIMNRSMLKIAGTTQVVLRVYGQGVALKNQNWNWYPEMLVEPGKRKLPAWW